MYVVTWIVLITLLNIKWIDSIRKRPTIAIVCLLKENYDILPFWLEYHSRLVGVNNIVMLDNFSSKNSPTRKILKEWEAKGLRVDWNQGPYIKKGDLTVAAFRRHFPRHDIGIPLDIDEIIVSYSEGRPNTTRAAFNHSIDQFKMHSRPCLVLNHYDTVCSYSENDTIETIHSVSTVLYDNLYGKKIFHLPVVIGLDHGNHHVDLFYGKCYTSKNLFGLIHYHFRNPKLTLQNALHDLRGFDHIDKSVTIENVKNYKEKLEDMIVRDVSGKHKAEEILRYLEHGYSGLVQYCDSNQAIYIGNITSILENM